MSLPDEAHMKAVSASEASRRFPSLLREVAAGTPVTIFSHHKPVATMLPVQQTQGVPHQARQRLLHRLRQQHCMDAPRTWTRDSLYDED